MRRKSTLTLIAAVCACLIVLSACSSVRPRDVVQEVYEALQKNDYKAAYDLTSSFFQQNTNYEAFEEAVKKLFEEKGELKQVEIGKTEMIGSQTALVNVTLTWSKDGSDTQEEKRITLPNEKGKWKVDGSIIIK
mgnify:CR=1 FL=1